MGDYLLNYTLKPDVLLTDAMCAAAAVPILLGPLKTPTHKFKWVKYSADGKTTSPVEPLYETLHLWDGGAYDNLGVEALVKDRGGNVYRKEINFLLVSDGAMEIKNRKTKWYQPTIMRLLDIAADQARALRLRSLWNHFNVYRGSGTCLKIGRTAFSINVDYGTNYPLATNNFDNAKMDRIKFYPATLMKMTENDFQDILNHGREVANAWLVCCHPSIFKNYPI